MATDQQAKIFWCWLRIRQVIQILISKIWLPSIRPWVIKKIRKNIAPQGLIPPGSLSRRGLKPRRVKLAGVWYPDESISLGSDTAASQSPWGQIPRWVISPGSDTPESQSPWGQIPPWVNLPGVSYPGESISLGSDTLRPVSQSPLGLMPGESISLDGKVHKFG